MSSALEIGRLTSMARSGDQSAHDLLWRTVFTLEHWFFLPRLQPGESLAAMAEKNQWPGVIAARIDGQQMVVAYTDQTRASAAAVANGCMEPSGEPALLKVPRQRAVAMLSQLPPEFHGLLMNHNDQSPGFATTLEHVMLLEDAVHESIPETGFDRFVRAAMTSKNQQVWMRLCERFADMPTWTVISEEWQPSDVMAIEVEGRWCIPVFTQNYRLEAGAQTGHLGPDGTQITGRALKPDQAWALIKERAERVKREHSNQVHATGGVLVMVNLGSEPWLMNLEQLEGVLRRRSRIA